VDGSDEIEINELPRLSINPEFDGGTDDVVNNDEG